MKYIFDFDDVLFHTSLKFKKHIVNVLEKNGISNLAIGEYFKNEEHNLFSLKKMLAHFSIPNALYEEIIKESENFTNEDLIKIIKKLGKENCYIVTYGDDDLQRDKIKNAGLSDLFSEIIVVSGSKKEAIERLCARHKDEEVLYIDDKAKHFENLDLDNYPNLKTILYTGQKLNVKMLSHA